MTQPSKPATHTPTPGQAEVEPIRKELECTRLIFTTSSKPRSCYWAAGTVNGILVTLTALGMEYDQALQTVAERLPPDANYNVLPDAVCELFEQRLVNEGLFTGRRHRDTDPE